MILTIQKTFVFSLTLLLCIAGPSLSLGPQAVAAVRDSGDQDSVNKTVETNLVETVSILAARVGEFEITTGAARALLVKSVPAVAEASKNKILMNAAVNRLVDRRLVYDFLNKDASKVGDAEIRLELEQFTLQLAKVEGTLDSYLKKNSLRKEEMEFEIGWRIAWSRYLKAQLTDDFLTRYFEKNRRQFDDSKMRVAHLLVKPSVSNQNRKGDTNQSEAWAEANAKADSILAKLKSGELNWNEAVEQHSDAPTKTSGGELGWIEYHKPMPPSFSVAAFELKEGERSQVVKTMFGFHILKCLELQEGKTGLKDAMVEVRQSATQHLFTTLAETERESQPVEYAGGFSKN